MPPIAAQAPPPPAPPAEPTLQLEQPTGPGQATPPVVVTFQDALQRARQNSADFLAAVADAQSATEDRKQARDSLLPSVSFSSQYFGTQGNGKTAVGRFVMNDGVHVYQDLGTIHQEVSSNTILRTGYKRASAAEALAAAKLEIARRGLAVAVSKAYYGLVVAQRKYATAQMALDEARNFLNISQDLERRGQAPNSDVIQAQIQYEQQAQSFEDAQLEMENARLGLAVLLFPALNENFTVVDDMDTAQPLPPFDDVRTMAANANPDIRAAMEALRQTQLDVTAAKSAFLPSGTIDGNYGIQANYFALHSINVEQPEAGVLPNLGYYIVAGINVPVWDWGILRSRLHQADIRREQARVQLSQTQREVLANLYSYYNEATVARAALDRLRQAADLAAESLRLINLRYQGGLSTVLDVVVAENTLTGARNAYDDGEVRYRTALANLQTLTGNF